MTTNATATTQPLKLSGISGANPLGFLAALGVLVVVRRSGYPKARLGWERSVTWIPVLDCASPVDPLTLSETLAAALRGRQVSSDADGNRVETQHTFDAAKKAVGDMQKEIKKRGFRGKDRRAAAEAELLPLQRDASEKRKVWLDALKSAVPRPELAIGKHINCTDDEYRDHAFAFLEDASYTNRETVDLLAAFGCDAPVGKFGSMAATPFCFITGSGHQYFLDTVRQLMDLVTPERIHAALFEPWAYRDDKLSMRWDPAEDRRYALMDRDPTASDNKSRTVWMANLLAYRALVLFPSAPSKKGLGTTAWNRLDGAPAFTWPIWEHPADPDSIRSLLQLPDLSARSPASSALYERGIVAAFRARRIQVGKPPLHKINFSPARTLVAHHLR
jgi:hypothetical protein